MSEEIEKPKRRKARRQKAGRPRPTAGGGSGRPAFLTAGQEMRMQILAESGVPAAEIAAEFGMTEKAVYHRFDVRKWLTPANIRKIERKFGLMSEGHEYKTAGGDTYKQFLRELQGESQDVVVQEVWERIRPQDVVSEGASVQPPPNKELTHVPLIPIDLVGIEVLGPESGEIGGDLGVNDPGIPGNVENGEIIPQISPMSEEFEPDLTLLPGNSPESREPVSAWGAVSSKVRPLTYLEQAQVHTAEEFRQVIRDADGLARKRDLVGAAYEENLLDAIYRASRFVAQLHGPEVIAASKDLEKLHGVAREVLRVGDKKPASATDSIRARGKVKLADSVRVVDADKPPDIPA